VDALGGDHDAAALGHSPLHDDGNGGWCWHRCCPSRSPQPWPVSGQARRGPTPAPFGVAVSQDGTQAYVINASDGTISVISTATATIPVGNSPDGVAVSPDGTLAYVINAGDGTVSVISTATSTVTATIPVGNFPAGVAVTPDGTLAYIVNAGDGTVSVISTGTRGAARRLPRVNYSACGRSCGSTASRPDHADATDISAT
jgi:YVTN family beta-propeller protein